MRNDTNLHLAIIMDGNGRWARARGLPRTAGHVEGARAVRAVVEAATADPRIATLTLFAFSSDNWERPRREVAGLLRLFGEYLRTETRECAENRVALRVIGRRDRLPARLVRRIGDAERATAVPRPRLALRLAIDYSSRWAILDAAVRLAATLESGDPPDPDRFRRLLSPPGVVGDVGDVGASSTDAAHPDAAHPDAASLGASAAPDVDLLIRTGGERRLSDFLLWESAYAELVFTRTLWPDFGVADLERALAEYDRRDRRFGRILEEAS